MRIGLPLEGVLVDMDAHFHFFAPRAGLEAESRMSRKVLRNESFWSSPKPNEDISEIADLMKTLADVDEFYIFTERPVALLPITRSWLTRNGLRIPEANIIFASSGLLKRYDCRLNKIDYFIDCDYETLNQFTYDRTIPVGIGEPENFNNNIQVHATVCEALMNLDVDLRREYIWQD